MVKILEQFEEGASSTTSINKHLCCSDNYLFSENLVGLDGSWTIGSFKDSLDLDLLGISSVNGQSISYKDHTVSCEFGEEFSELF